jgi:hypothetical protein
MRTISKGRCRYEMVLIFQPPNAHVRISRILLGNAMAMAGVKKIYRPLEHSTPEICYIALYKPCPSRVDTLNCWSRGYMRLLFLYGIFSVFHAASDWNIVALSLNHMLRNLGRALLSVFSIVSPWKLPCGVMYFWD